jgi:hypothetical protein
LLFILFPLANFFFFFKKKKKKIEFEATPLLASPCFPAQDDSFRYNLSGPLGIVTSPPNNNMVNLLNMSNTLNTGYPINNKQTSNIFESNSKNDRHLPYVTYVQY